MQELQYIRPESIIGVLDYLDSFGETARILAGGTDLIIALKDKLIACKYLIDIKGIKEFNRISYSEEEGLSIGCAVCLNDIIETDFIKENYEVLTLAGKTLANQTLRNRATLIGNICNSSPGGDMLPASLVLGGKLEIASKDGYRIIALNEFFTGVKKNVLKPNEIVTRIVFSPIKGTGKYLKKSRIKGHDLAQIGIAIYHLEDGELRAAVCAAGPTPILISGLRKYTNLELIENQNEIIETILKGLSPIDDVRATKNYREAMVKYLTKRILEDLGGK